MWFTRHRHRPFISVAAGIFLLSMLIVGFGYVWQGYYANTIVQPFFRRGNWAVIWNYATLTAILFRAYDCLHYGYLKRVHLVCNQCIAMVIVHCITYIQISIIGRKFLPTPPLITLTVLDALLILLWSAIIHRVYQRRYPPLRLVIVYSARHAAELAMKMSERQDKYMICESVDMAVGLQAVREKLKGFDGVILCELPAAGRNDLLEYCYAQGLRCYITPDVSDILLRGAEEIRLFDTPLLLCRNAGLSTGEKTIKRISDVIISAMLMLLTLPLWLICAIAIRAEDGGSIIYRQQRLTEGGKVFEMLKFRSMVPHAETMGQAVTAAEQDTRITKVGRWLRRFRLDELPQLWNILKGDMSLVGPRPERPQLAAQYTRFCPEFAFRLRVKAGLTGYAQVIGTYDTEPADKLKMDLMYIEQYSLLLDIRILLMTVRTAILPHRTNAAARRAIQRTVQKERRQRSHFKL
ncbi:MAG: exopolysaccharide biosynthesis polyprenyl glycosylphosphotransferase [Oscillospiraceae bacterium]